MPRDVEAEEFLLEGESLGRGEVSVGSNGRSRMRLAVAVGGRTRRGRVAAEHVEEAVLAGRAITGLRRGAGERGVDAVEELLARRSAEIKRPRLHEMFEHALVDRTSIDPLHELRERGVRS